MLPDRKAATSDLQYLTRSVLRALSVRRGVEQDESVNSRRDKQRFDAHNRNLARVTQPGYPRCTPDRSDPAAVS